MSTTPGGDPGTLAELAAKLASTAASVDDLTASTRQQTATIRDNADWTGQAADSYTAFTQNLATGFGRAVTPLQRIASAVRSYAEVLQSTQQRASATNYVQDAAAANPTDSALSTEAQALGQAASDALTALESEAAQAEAVIKAATSDLANLFGTDGPVRKWIEGFHFPWDATGSDAILVHYIDQAEEAEKAEKVIPAQWEKLTNVMQEFLDHKVSMASLQGELRGSASTIEDAEAAVQKGGDLTGALPGMKGLGVTMAGLAMAGDAYTFIAPEDSGGMRVVDRVASGTNFLLSGTGAAIDLGLLGAEASMPVVGEVALVGTGLYLAGDWAYHNQQLLGHVASDVGHAVVSAPSKIGHAAASVAGKIGSWF